MTAHSLTHGESVTLPFMDSAQTSPIGMDARLVLSAFLGCLLLLIGLLCSWGIKHVDQNYSRLITLTAQDLDRLHDISYHSGISCATAVKLMTTDDPVKRQAMLQVIADERSANNQVFAELLAKTQDTQIRAGLQQVLETRAAFTVRADEFVKGILSTTASEHSIPPSAPMLEAFVHYQAACERLGDLVHSNSLRSSDELARDSMKYRLFFFAVGTLPVLLGLVGILLTFYYVLRTPAEADLRV
jgi:hypothetical protein